MAYDPKAVKAVMDSLTKYGVTNPFVQKGVLGTIAKESKFVPKSESGYGGTSNARIRTIFGKRVADLSEDQLTIIKADPVKFFNKVYGGWMGNMGAGDGYRYRGRGFNQLTGKDNYNFYSKRIGRDLVANPDLVNDPEVAAEVSAAFFDTAFKNKTLLNKIGVSNINDVKDIQTGVRAAVQANAGAGTSLETEFMKENLRRALDAVSEFGEDVLETIKRRPGTTIAIILSISLLITGIVMFSQK